MSFVTTALAPSPDLFAEGAILINKNGERFTDELDKPAYALPDQPGKVGYILLDRRMAELFSGWPHFISTAPGVAYAYVDDYRRNRADIFNAGATLDELAGKLAVPAAALAETVARTMPSAGNRPQGRRRALCGARTAARGVRACRRRACGRSRASRAGRRRPADPGSLRGRLDRAGRLAAQGPRPSSRLGLRVRPARRAQRGIVRIPQYQLTYSIMRNSFARAAGGRQPSMLSAANAPVGE